MKKQLIKRSQLRQNLQKGREAQIHRKQQEIETNKEIENIMRNEWNKKSLEIAAIEQLEKIRIIQMNKQQQDYLKTQIIEKQHKFQLQTQKEREEFLAQLDANQREEQLFNNYTKQIMTQHINKGRSIQAAKRAIQLETMRTMRAGHRLMY